MVDFEDEEFDEPCAMVQINRTNPSALKDIPEQRTILKMRSFMSQRKIHKIRRFQCLKPGVIVMMAPTTYVVSLSVNTQLYQILF